MDVLIERPLCSVCVYVYSSVSVCFYSGLPSGSHTEMKYFLTQVEVAGWRNVCVCVVLAYSMSWG